MPKQVSIDDQNHAGLTSQSLRAASYDWSVAIFITSLESQESYLTLRNLTLQTCLSITRDFSRLHSTFARLYNAAASPASRLRSADSLAIKQKTLFAFCSSVILSEYRFSEQTISFNPIRRLVSKIIGHICTKGTSKLIEISSRNG